LAQITNEFFQKWPALPYPQDKVRHVIRSSTCQIIKNAFVNKFLYFKSTFYKSFTHSIKSF